MRTIHLLTQKESINESLLTDSTAVVIDVFLATSTIAFLLENNYTPVYTTDKLSSAIKLKKEKTTENILLLGEDRGEPVDQFVYPDPTHLTKQNIAQPVVFRSTNGTIAIESAKNSRRLYLSSIVNSHAVAEKILNHDDRSSIVIICSGNDDRFSMEDFIGAGHLISHLTKQAEFNLSDGAKVALQSFEHAESIDFRNLLTSETKYLLDKYNFNNAVQYVIDHYEKVNIVPTYDQGRFIK